MEKLVTAHPVLLEKHTWPSLLARDISWGGHEVGPQDTSVETVSRDPASAETPQGEPVPRPQRKKAEKILARITYFYFTY